MDLGKTWEFLATNSVMPHLYAFLLLAGFSWLLQRVLAGKGGAKGAKPHQPGLGPLRLALGIDNRVSTSKVQVLLWTYAVAFALLSLVLHGKLSPVNFELDGTYLLLLGSPAAAALLAKGITTAKVRSGTVAKPAASNEPPLGKGLAQVVSDDEGNVEVFDLQYFVFTLVALAFFLVGFFQSFGTDRPGLPELPPALVALTGVSAATYVVRKGIENEEPVLTAAYPQAAFAGEKVHIRGKNLAFEIPDSEPVKPEVVLFGGRPATPVSYSSASVEARVPEDLEPGLTELEVLRSDGILTGELEFRVAERKPRITAVQPSRIVLGVDHHVRVCGVGFGQSDDGAAPEGAGILLDGRDLAIAEDGGWGPATIRAELPSVEQAEQQGYKLPGSAELIVVDARGVRSEPQTVELTKPESSP